MASGNIYISEHDKKIHRIIKLLAKANNININKYNFYKMVSYQCKGYDITGSRANTRDSRRHFIVKNNHYDVYEIPNKSNHDLRMTGNFLVLIYNKDFNIWFLATMNHSFIKCKGIVKEDVEYYCYGEFRITEQYDKFSYHCVCSEGYCDRGIRARVFDGDNIRKTEGYHTTWSVINKKFGIKHFE